LAVVEVDGQDLLASASDDETVRLWDPATGQEHHRMRVPTSALSIAAHGELLIVGLANGLVAVELGTRPQQATPKLFLAHASPDRPAARLLHDRLESAGFDVFLDEADLAIGDEWDRMLPTRQAEAAATIVLVSRHTELAHYERSEITRAVNLARRLGHRVLPIFLEPIEPKQVPYGLENIHSWTIGPDLTLETAARHLASQLGSLLPPS
jgi:hypothetical protein